MRLKHCPECCTVKREDRIELYPDGRQWCDLQHIGPWSDGPADLVAAAQALLLLGIAKSANMVHVTHPRSVQRQHDRGFSVTRLGVSYETDAQADRGSTMLEEHGWIDSGGVKWAEDQKGGHRSYDR